MDRHLLRLNEKDPYLSLHFIMLFVRDQERSLRFYVDQLGFRLIVDQIIPTGSRWIEVGPPDGSANLALAPLRPETDPSTYLGRDTNVYFLSEDVHWEIQRVEQPRSEIPNTSSDSTVGRHICALRRS